MNFDFLIIRSFLSAGLQIFLIEFSKAALVINAKYK